MLGSALRLCLPSEHLPALPTRNASGKPLQVPPSCPPGRLKGLGGTTRPRARPGFPALPRERPSRSFGNSAGRECPSRKTAFSYVQNSALLPRIPGEKGSRFQVMDSLWEKGRGFQVMDIPKGKGELIPWGREFWGKGTSTPGEGELFPCPGQSKRKRGAASMAWRILEKRRADSMAWTALGKKGELIPWEGEFWGKSVGFCLLFCQQKTTSVPGEGEQIPYHGQSKGSRSHVLDSPWEKGSRSHVLDSPKGADPMSWTVHGKRGANPMSWTVPKEKGSRSHILDSPGEKGSRSHVLESAKGKGEQIPCPGQSMGKGEQIPCPGQSQRKRGADPMSWRVPKEKGSSFPRTWGGS
ncbi:uncharacterized protein LOC134557111 [Prinia subflava]|uniref:uncharacterized protein LOC134557111 n=1 Tax=Prinia subflava TaxID=208062 RepID=UPI002FE1019F